MRKSIPTVHVCCIYIVLARLYHDMHDPVGLTAYIAMLYHDDVCLTARI